MSDKINELLSVLDMTEDEQFEWCAKCDLLGGTVLHTDRDSMYLADLAFRLRDEAIVHSHRWDYGRRSVSDYLDKPLVMWDEWSQPIHWIIASLIAKELKCSGKS